MSTTGVWIAPKDEPKPPAGAIGDKAGYVVLQQHHGLWIGTDGAMMDDIGRAVGRLRTHQEKSPERTYAVGRLEVVMISRPDNG